MHLSPSPFHAENKSYSLNSSALKPNQEKKNQSVLSIPPFYKRGDKG